MRRRRTSRPCSLNPPRSPRSPRRSSPQSCPQPSPRHRDDCGPRRPATQPSLRRLLDTLFSCRLRYLPSPWAWRVLIAFSSGPCRIKRHRLDRPDRPHGPRHLARLQPNHRRRRTAHPRCRRSRRRARCIPCAGIATVTLPALRPALGRRRRPLRRDVDGGADRLDDGRPHPPGGPCRCRSSRSPPEASASTRAPRSRSSSLAITLVVLLVLQRVLSGRVRP